MPEVCVDNVRLFYHRKGNGYAVVFLHGYTGSSDDFVYQIPVVSEQFQTICMDHRGHGKSEAPDREDAYTIDIFSEDVYAVLRELKIEKCCLIGHSMGGFIALQFVLDHPDMVKALVLLDTSSGEWDIAPGYLAHRQKLDELAQTKGLEAAFEYDAENNPQRIERFHNHPEQREIAKQRVMNTSIAGYVYTARSFKKWTPVTSRLHEITVPTLIFLGEEDVPFYRPTQVLRESILNVWYVMVPMAGHCPQEDAPDFVNEHLMNFLSQVVPRHQENFGGGSGTAHQ